MVRAKNCETMSTFVRVMQKKLWPLFFQTRCTHSSLGSILHRFGDIAGFCAHDLIPIPP